MFELIAQISIFEQTCLKVMDQNHIFKQDCSINVFLLNMHTNTEQHNNIYEVYTPEAVSHTDVWAHSSSH